MGISFYKMCYFHIPKSSNIVANDNGYNVEFEKIEEFNDDNAKYSPEMFDIISSMMQDDIKNVKTARYYYEKIKECFAKKYLSNTSLDSTIRCFATFKNKADVESKPLISSFLKCLRAFGSDKWDNSIQSFRQVLCTENSQLEKTNEIEPRLILAYVLKQLYSEDIKKSNLNKKENEYYIKSGEEVSKTSKMEMMLKFRNKFSQTYNSNSDILDKKFFCLMKGSRFCTNCNKS